MYGFFKPIQRIDDYETYRMLYCGQCMALKNEYGYFSRLLLSYDTTLIGLLIIAQQSNSNTIAKNKCLLRPKQFSVFNPKHLTQKIMASLSILLLHTKFIDDTQDKGLSFNKKALRLFFNKKIVKANNFLSTLDFPITLFDKLYSKQKIIENKRLLSLLNYAEPTALFTAEIFGHTSIIAGCVENYTFLYRIGYNIGRIVYLIDSCIDITDDIKSNQFNALLAASENEDFFSNKTDSNHEIVPYIIKSIHEVKKYITHLKLYNYKKLLNNILIESFISNIALQLKYSTSKVLKEKINLPHKCVPHLALYTALLNIIPAKPVKAGIAMGKEIIVRQSHQDCIDGTYYTYNKYIGYGCSLSPDKLEDSDVCFLLFEALANPFFFMFDKDKFGFLSILTTIKIVVLIVAPFINQLKKSIKIIGGIYLSLMAIIILGIISYQFIIINKDLLMNYALYATILFTVSVIIFEFVKFVKRNKYDDQVLLKINSIKQDYVEIELLYDNVNKFHKQISEFYRNDKILISEYEKVLQILYKKDELVRISDKIDKLKNNYDGLIENYEYNYTKYLKYSKKFDKFNNSYEHNISRLNNFCDKLDKLKEKYNFLSNNYKSNQLKENYNNLLSSYDSIIKQLNSYSKEFANLKKDFDKSYLDDFSKFKKDKNLVTFSNRFNLFLFIGIFLSVLINVYFFIFFTYYSSTDYNEFYNQIHEIIQKEQIKLKNEILTELNIKIEKKLDEVKNIQVETKRLSNYIEQKIQKHRENY